MRLSFVACSGIGTRGAHSSVQVYRAAPLAPELIDALDTLFMRVIITRVTEASVSVDGEVVSRLPRPGLLVLVGIGHGDGAAEARAVAAKTWSLRILQHERSASDCNAPILVISQFTLHGATRKGRRPSWSAAAPAEASEPLVEQYCTELEHLGAEVLRGRFGADMQVASVNDGPITILIDTDDWR